MTWAQGILTLQPGVSALVADTNPLFKLHLFLGMTIFLVFPFTRLVHVWSAPVWYLGRRGYQVVRSSRPAAQGMPVYRGHETQVIQARSPSPRTAPAE
jgi:nitrate reductase gamma subunit